MNRLENLPQIADEMLGGLKAGQDLKYRILNQAKAEAKPARRKNAWMPILAGACALVLAVTLGLSVLDTQTPQVLEQPNEQFMSMTAGQNDAQPKVRALLDLPPGSIQLSGGDPSPAYRSIWSPQNGGNFPLIGVNGKYYRMLRNPTGVSSGLLGEALGEITEFTDEPSLAAANQLVSNAASQGETVYAVKNMKDTMVAAKVDGKMRVFQRVTYAGHSTVGGESLGDTLRIKGRVIAMELSGVGTITDSDTAQRLANTLLSNARYKNDGASSGKQSLLIQLDNGLTVQMVVKNGTLSACGGWTCPEFFEAFEAAVK